jgi:FkbM family methyltransferase
MNSPSVDSTNEPHRVDLDAYLARPSQALHEFSRLHPADAAVTIFDIGCCEGEDSIRFSRHFRHARVLAFEALPDNQRICRENFALYQATRTELVPVALCDRVGTTDFHVSSGAPKDGVSGWNYGNKSSSVLPPKGGDPMLGWLEFRKKITVPCSTLDQVCADRGIARLELVHMDVQGAESLVLAGATRMLPRVGAIWLEVSAREYYAGQKLKAEVGRQLRAAGFLLLREFMRPDGEGDQVWLNRRSARSWLRLARATLGSIKFALLHRRRPA